MELRWDQLSWVRIAAVSILWLFRGRVVVRLGLSSTRFQERQGFVLVARGNQPRIVFSKSG